MRPASVLVSKLERHVADLLNLVRLGRRSVVVQEAGAAREALDPEELFRIQRAVRLSELGVSLVGHLAALDVEHASPFYAGCSGRRPVCQPCLGRLSDPARMLPANALEHLQ